MSDENKEVVRRFFAEVINAGRTDRADTFVTADYIEHQQLPGAEGRQGIEIAKAFLSMMRAAFPDFRFDIEDLVAEGDKVVARLTVSGTQHGAMLGLTPTGKHICTSGIEEFRFAGDRIAELWATFDTLGMLRQLGLRPVPGPALLIRTVAHYIRRRLPNVLKAR
jgi:steroid delta-isomerase-like uncharacterized protein